MNIREMHIEVSQGTQNIAANVTRKLSFEQIDWLLNKNTERFVQSKVKPRADGSGGFQIEQVNADAIRTLLKAKPFSAAALADNEYTAPLPDDYAYLLSDDAAVSDLCGNLPPAATPVVEDILKIQFKNTVAVSPNCYAAVSITFGATTLTLSDINTAYAGTFTGLKSPTEKYIVISALLWYIRNVLKKTVYWETYKDVVAPQSFIFPGETAGSITIDGTLTAGTTQQITYNKYTEGSVWIPNRLSPTTVISTLMVTPFYKSTVNSTISELQANSLKVYADASFIITGVRMNYVKKFRRMNLVLGQDCELPEDFHQTICDLTVEYFKALTQDPNWEVKLKDNMLRSPSTT